MTLCLKLWGGVICLLTFLPKINNYIAIFIPIKNDPNIYNTFINVFGPLAQFPVLWTGIITYFIIKRLRAINIKKPKIISYMLLMISLYMLYRQIYGKNDLSEYNISVYVAFSFWFSLIIISQEIYSIFLIDNPLFRILGKYSYGMYLFQFIWLKFYTSNISNFVNLWLIKFIISIIALLVISFVLTKFFNDPIQRNLKRAINK